MKAKEEQGRGKGTRKAKPGKATKNEEQSKNHLKSQETRRNTLSKQKSSHQRTVSAPWIPVTPRYLQHPISARHPGPLVAYDSSAPTEFILLHHDTKDMLPVSG